MIVFLLKPFKLITKKQLDNKQSFGTIFQKTITLKLVYFIFSFYKCIIKYL